jgi:Zinc knuckle
MLSAGREAPIYPAVENTLQVAQKLYLEMISTNKWAALNTKGSQASFVAKPNNDKPPPRKLTCWNCGIDGHYLKDCTKPQNQALINQHKKSFKVANKRTVVKLKGRAIGVHQEQLESTETRREQQMSN